MPNYNFNYETKAKIVLAGDSKILAEWQKGLPNLSEDMFLHELCWLCEDPRDKYGKLTREIGLTRIGIVRLDRIYDPATGMTTFRYHEGKRKGELWDGDSFLVPCPNPNYADENGMVSQRYKISLSAADRI